MLTWIFLAHAAYLFTVGSRVFAMKIICMTWIWYWAVLLSWVTCVIGPGGVDSDTLLAELDDPAQDTVPFIMRWAYAAWKRVSCKAPQRAK